MAGGVGMALGSLMSLVFRREWLAASMLRLAKTLNHPNQIRGQDGQAFPLPSRLRPSRTPKTTTGGAIRIDFIDFSGKATPPPLRQHCRNQLTDRSKPTEGRLCFYLAVAEPSLLPPKFARCSPPGRNRNGLAEMTTRPSLALGIAAEFGLHCRSGVQRDVRFRADDRHRPDTTCAVRKARARRCGGRPAARVYALDLQLCGRFSTGSGAAIQLTMIDIGYRTPSQ
jgi:hypothetical protein